MFNGLNHLYLSFFYCGREILSPYWFGRTEKSFKLQMLRTAFSNMSFGAILRLGVNPDLPGGGGGKPYSLHTDLGGTPVHFFRVYWLKMALHIWLLGEDCRSFGAEVVCL